MGASSESEHHRRFDGLAVQHVLGGLDDTDGRLFRAHLLECGHCRARVGELRAIAHDLADVERDEERAQATQQLETKQHDDHPPRLPSDQRGRGRSVSNRVVVVALLVVVSILSIWVFFLRADVAELEGQLEVAIDANRTLEAGRAWEVETLGDADAEVREDGGALVVVVNGLSDGNYWLDVADDEGEVLASQEARPTDGRLFVLLQDVEPSASSVTLRVDEAGTPPVVEAHAER